jgi:hypothetical protein
MRRSKDRIRCIGGLLFEVLIVSFIVFSSLSIASSGEVARGNNTTLTATPLYPIAIREAEDTPKQLINSLPSVWLKVATSLLLTEDKATTKQLAMSDLSIGLCHFNIYYTRITAKAP